MSKTVRISGEVHAVAKTRAKAVGLKIQSFIEQAIKRYFPEISVQNEPRRARRKAG